MVSGAHAYVYYLYTWTWSSRVCFILLLCFLDNRPAREHSNDDRTDGSERLKPTANYKGSLLCLTGPTMHIYVCMYRIVRAIRRNTYVNVLARLYEYMQHNIITETVILTLNII